MWKEVITSVTKAAAIKNDDASFCLLLRQLFQTDTVNKIAAPEFAARGMTSSVRLMIKSMHHAETPKIITNCIREAIHAKQSNALFCMLQWLPMDCHNPVIIGMALAAGMFGEAMLLRKMFAPRFMHGSETNAYAYLLKNAGDPKKTKILEQWRRR